MTATVFARLAAIFVLVAIGFAAGRLRWLGTGDAGRVISNAALYLFIPALLFRTTARVDLAALPWRTVAAFLLPAAALLIAVYLWQRRAAAGAPARPAVRALGASFGNTVQVGIPLAAALFGEAGLAIHVTIVSLHALTLLTVATALAEFDLAREQHTAGGPPRHPVVTLLQTVRNTVVHPVVLPVLAGFAWNLGALPLPAVADEVLQSLALAVVPVCLLLIGLSLAEHGLAGAAREALPAVAIKLLALPLLVGAAAHFVAGLQGTPLAVVVLLAALPVGSNPLIFAQRYRTAEAEMAAAIVLSTAAFVVTAPLALAAVQALR